MYLKSIEVNGFKSFANKIVFQFHNGITGIVGPNGSGKSNVADAVRWVLGEQSVKQLRGSSMQDVIFSGTELRKPLSYAYVAITLDNSDHALAVDYDEVTVGRRIYRSGESEYILNGTICRLKDINELFYDTGIGKEGYSIIGQGQIDKILSGKPEDRRELFDEAAGIVKFKRRKAASVSKLQNEEANLVRVSDILNELEKQIGPLERQSETAKIYLKKKEDLKVLDINSFLLENEKTRGLLEDISKKRDITQSELNETNVKHTNIRTEYDEIASKIEALENTIEEKRASLSNTDVIREKLEGEINVLNTGISSCEGYEQHYKQRNDTLSGQINDKKAELADLNKIADESATSLEEVKSDSENARLLLANIQKEITEINDSVESGKNTIIEELNKRAVIKSKIAGMDAQTETLNVRTAELANKIIHAKSFEEEHKKKISELENEFAKAADNIRALRKEVENSENVLSSFREQLTKEDGNVRETELSFHQNKSRLDALKDLADKYEGYGASVKKVMEQKSTEKGLIGVVADLIEVDKKYETAIEVALGGNIQNIVTKDEASAKRMIEFLKENKGGRATFLPLTTIKDSEEFKAKEAINRKGAIGLAHTLVKIAPEYSDVAKSMLGRILVVDNIDNALNIAKEFRYTVRMVTIDGEMLVPGGAISGGAFKNNNNFLGRNREIAELEKIIASLSKKIEEGKANIEKIKNERNAKRLEIELKKSDLQTAEIAQNTIRINLANAREEMKTELDNATGLKAEEELLKEKSLSLVAEKENIAKALTDSEKLEDDINTQILEYTRKLEALRLDEADAMTKVNEWDVKLEKINQSLEFNNANRTRILHEITSYEDQLAEVEMERQKNLSLIQEKKDNIEKIRETIKASYDEQNKAGNELKEALSMKEELSKKQKSFFDIREELSAKMNSLDKELYRLNAQKERLEENITNQINYMWDEYEVSLSDAAMLRDDSLDDLPAMKRRIATIKDEIKKLGDVNVNAIEEFKEVSERYTFLKTQHDDLVEAKKTLEDIIAELDVQMRKQFQEKFKEIASEFDSTFKELFGGGKASLELIEDEDILEAGIRINAQPPGKKLQNMMQLSGGEKALTAISLLFAIQNLKPSPFCLLDEIEAALDDSNVGRFAKYLHKLTKNTQFIVITHRRGTMEEVDRLYGITMQEKGVSTLVSVNLIDKELDD